MATAPTHHRVPVEIYLRSSHYEPDAEYVDGEIEERPAGTYDHSSWQAAILMWFSDHPHEWNVRARLSLRTQVTSTRFRVPDVTVLDRSLPIEQIITHPPVAVFEILSPEDSMTRVLRKLKDYAAMGIRNIWVIDPEEGKGFYQFRNGQLAPASVFGTSGEPIHFEMSEIEKLLD